MSRICRMRTRRHKDEPSKTLRLTTTTLPSFSSSLLDEIDLSIDASASKPEHEPERRRTSRIQDEEEATTFPRLRAKTNIYPGSSHARRSDSELKVPWSFSVPNPVRTTRKTDASKVLPDTLIKSESRATKISSILKKLKQPISPGIKLASFNALFANKNGNKVIHDPKFTKGCSVSGPLFSSKKSKENVANRTAHEKCSSHKPPLPEMKERMRSHGVVVTSTITTTSRVHHIKGGNRGYKEQDIDDALSDSSSDLFELDHLVLLGRKNAFYQPRSISKMNGDVK